MNIVNTRLESDARTFWYSRWTWSDISVDCPNLLQSSTRLRNRARPEDQNGLDKTFAQSNRTCFHHFQSGILQLWFAVQNKIGNGPKPTRWPNVIVGASPSCVFYFSLPCALSLITFFIALHVLYLWIIVDRGLTFVMAASTLLYHLSRLNSEGSHNSFNFLASTSRGILLALQW